MKIIHFRKAQAVLEIGILGTVVLIIFSLLVGYIQSLNDEQYVLMSNFRQALKKAHDENAVVSYTTLEDRRHVDINAPLVGKRTNLSASSYVHWAVPYVGEKPNKGFYYQINDQVVALDEDDEVGDIVFEYDTNIARVFNKVEAGDIIRTIQNVGVVEELTYTLRDSDEEPITTVTQNRTDNKQRSWETGQ
ncbi:MAG: hypothetical protein KAS05_04075 [Candidatus Omnitrophica bacterium]|nr:hypothetical protein [Candidatus Omnitrophota bacterium]